MFFSFHLYPCWIGLVFLVLLDTNHETKDQIALFGAESCVSHWYLRFFIFKLSVLNVVNFCTKCVQILQIKYMDWNMTTCLMEIWIWIVLFEWCAYIVIFLFLEKLDTKPACYLSLMETSFVLYSKLFCTIIWYLNWNCFGC